MCRLSGSGILAIIALAILRAGVPLVVMREIDGWSELNQSPPHLMPFSIPQSRDVNRTPLPGSVRRTDAVWKDFPDPSKRKLGTFTPLMVMGIRAGTSPQR